MMIWGCLRHDGLAAVYVLDMKRDGRLNALQYQEILREHLCPLMENQYDGKDFVFQQDNAPAHTAKVVGSNSF